MRSRMVVAAAALAHGWSAPGSPLHGQAPQTNRVSAVAAGDLRTWDARLTRMERDGSLRLRIEREDTLVPGRRHRRLTQTIDGVPVYGGDIAQQLDSSGLTISVFGTLYEAIDIATTPTLTADDAQAVAAAASGVELGPARLPTLTILPVEGSGPRLVYLARAATAQDVVLYFIDAHTGAIVLSRSDAQRQTAAVGLGTGVLGDRKKISASAQSGTFVGADRLRPPAIETYNMRGNLSRVLAFLNGVITGGASDLAADPDHDWGDGANRTEERRLGKE
jgi:Zn-dependent metalloprotease